MGRTNVGRSVNRRKDSLDQVLDPLIEIRNVRREKVQTAVKRQVRADTHFLALHTLRPQVRVADIAKRVDTMTIEW